MESLDVSGSKNEPRPYRSLREDPRYAEIKKMIEEMPPEMLGKLRLYIKRWLRNS